MQPSSWLEKSPRLGTGYLSGLVARLRRRKSPHGRQLPSFFFTMWRGLLHWLSDRRTTPSRSQAAKISLAERSLSESRRLNLDVTGGPSVCRKCWTPTAGGGMDFLVEQTSEKEVMMGWMSAGRAANTGLLRERERMPGKMAPPLRRTQAAAGSTVRLNFLRKSMPRMGPSTSPVMKSNLHWCSTDWLSFRRRMRDLSGPVAMAAPLAAVSRRPCGEAGPGTRETEAPVSAKKRAPVVWSLRKTKCPGRTALTPGRLSFPTRSSCRRSCRSSHRR